MPSVHAINLEPFKTSRLKVKRLIREPTIFPQNRAERRKERERPANINN